MAKQITQGNRRIIAEMISSTVRVLELLGFGYTVRNSQKGEAKSPRVIKVRLADDEEMYVYNGLSGRTWANAPNGEPISSITSPETLHEYLKELPRP